MGSDVRRPPDGAPSRLQVESLVPLAKGVSASAVSGVSTGAQAGPTALAGVEASPWTTSSGAQAGTGSAVADAVAGSSDGAQADSTALAGAAASRTHAVSSVAKADASSAMVTIKVLQQHLTTKIITSQNVQMYSFKSYIKPLI